MVGKIIGLNNGEQYYIIDELKYKNKLYVFCSIYLKDKDDIDSDNYYAFEVKIINKNITLNDITDEKIAIEVSKQFIEKLHSKKANE